MTICAGDENNDGAVHTRDPGSSATRPPAVNATAHLEHNVMVTSAERDRRIALKRHLLTGQQIYIYIWHARKGDREDSRN